MWPGVGPYRQMKTELRIEDHQKNSMGRGLEKALPGTKGAAPLKLRGCPVCSW